TNYDRYDMTHAYNIDSIFNAAEQNDIQIMFTIWFHGALRDISHPWSGGGQHWWEVNPFKNIPTTATTFFSNSTSWQYQQNLYRYMLARWGSSRALGYWHTVSEFNGTQAAPDGNNITGYGNTWHTNITNYFKTNDPFRHPITASRGDITSWDTGFRVMDLVQAHSYDYVNNPVQEAITIGNWTKNMWSTYTNKPNCMGEFGASNASLQPAHIHYSNWAGVLAGAAVGPLDWNDGGSWGDMTPAMFTTMRVLRNYVADIQFDKLNLQPATVSAGSGYAGYGLTNSTTAYFWIMDNTPGETISSLTPLVSGVSTGRYRVYWWNTWTGTTISISTAYAGSGLLYAPTPSFQNDIAAKAYWTDTASITITVSTTTQILYDFDTSTEGWRPYTTWGSATITGPVYVESTSYNGNGAIRYTAIINPTGWSDVKGASPELNGADWSNYSMITGYIYFPSGAASIPTRIFTTSGSSNTWQETATVSVPIGVWTPLVTTQADIANSSEMHIYGFKVGGSSVSYNGSIYFDYVTETQVSITIVPVELSRFEIE
ncbi:MAG: hypothetical protein QME64_11870, partial [bacterium]|nr:hypothetical protein [bacterium]